MSPFAPRRQGARVTPVTHYSNTNSGSFKGQAGMTGCMQELYDPAEKNTVAEKHLHDFVRVNPPPPPLQVF